MPAGKPETTTMNVTDARAQFSSLLNRVFRGKQRVIVEKNGIPVAALISARDLERLHVMEARIERDLETLERISEPFKDIPPEEIEAEVARIIQKNREAGRHERVAQESA